jgi:putative sigma-54 modulation protein
MDVIIQSIGFTAGEDLETFIHEKMDKFNKESEIIRANVALSIGAEPDPNKYCCEIRLEVPGNDLFIKKNSDTFQKAIASATEGLQRSRRRAKERLMGRQRKA